MSFIENENLLSKNNTKLLKVRITEQKVIINTLKKILLERELNNKRIPQELTQKIQKIIDEKLYLKKDISLTILAKKTNTNRTYLSRYMNKEYSSFYNFLNLYRIKEACHILKNEKTIILKTLYEWVGYKSQNTFYKAFKSLKKTTPGKYYYSFNKYSLYENEVFVTVR